MVQDVFCPDPFFYAFTDVPSEWGTRFEESKGTGVVFAGSLKLMCNV